MIEIFKTGEYDYSDENIDKPVKYTVQNLIDVASRTSKINVTKEHEDEVISEMSNFIVRDGLLLSDKPNNLELKGKGFSPVFEFDLIDCGDYYEPTNIKMTEIGYTDSPRSQIVYNSIKVANEDNAMDDKEIQKLIKRNNDLQEQIGVLKNEKKQLTKTIEDKNKEIKEIKDSYVDVDAKLEEYESLKEIETNYNQLVSSKKDDLIHQIVGDDKDKAERLQKYSVEDLEFQIELMSGDSKPQGITPNQVHIDDGSDPSPNNDDDDADFTDEEIVKFYEDTFGEKPSVVDNE